MLPEPTAYFLGFGDSALNFRLLYWVQYEYGQLTKSEISIEIYKEFQKHQINIPFPQMDVHIKKQDES
jgi:small-conductance mechanosensitive channel